MADNKQYVTQVQDNGSVMISEDVIATIVINAVSEVEGVVGFTTKPGAEIADMLGMKNWGKGLKLNIDDNGTVAIDCNVVVAYGQSVVTVAQNVQTAVTSALDSTANIQVKSVNVNVCGIVRQ